MTKVTKSTVCSLCFVNFRKKHGKNTRKLTEKKKKKPGAEEVCARKKDYVLLPLPWDVYCHPRNGGKNQEICPEKAGGKTGHIRCQVTEKLVTLPLEPVFCTPVM